MRARKHFGVWIVFFVAFSARWCLAGGEPRLSSDAVAEVADAKARDGGYDVVAYIHNPPYYFKTIGVWDVHYYYKSSKPGGGRSSAFVITVNDTTEFVSLYPSISGVAATPRSSESTRVGGLSFWRAVALALSIGAVMRFASWLYGKRLLAQGEP